MQLNYENILLQEHFIAEDWDNKNDDQVFFDCLWFIPDFFILMFIDWHKTMSQDIATVPVLEKTGELLIHWFYIILEILQPDPYIYLKPVYPT